ncbi:hypothetical protein V6N13_143629 [Hibiscus sabdariffa]
MDKALVYGTRDSGFDPQRSRLSFFLLFLFPEKHQNVVDFIVLLSNKKLRGPMDKALVYGTRDSGFDPQRSRLSFFLLFLFPEKHQNVVDFIVLLSNKKLRGPMDKALVYGTRDSGFDPQRTKPAST